MNPEQWLSLKWNGGSTMSDRWLNQSKIIHYIRNRKDSLMTYLEDGRCSLSNNLSENAIRPITVGRKNWLFCDSVDGANASAICFTMIEMAKAYDLNVYKYLNFLLEKRPNARTAQKELEKLAPWNEEVQKMFARKMK